MNPRNSIFLSPTLWRIIFFVACLLGAYLALTPTPPKEADVFGWDKLNHGAAFAVLAGAAVLGFRQLPPHNGMSDGKRFSMIGGGLLAYGAGIEIAQMWVPGRSAEWGDMLANSLGIALGLLTAGALLRQLNSRQ